MSKDASKKLYVCNRKRCRNCYSVCNLTSDVRFAAIDDTVVIADGITGAWIPCSERLPEESGDYLVTYEWVGASGTRYTEVEIVPFVHNRWEFFIDPEEVLAWMPLPEPYKEGAGE